MTPGWPNTRTGFLRDQIGIQLYTLRNQLGIDFEGTLAASREIGYRRVEHAGFVGRTVNEFKAALDAVGSGPARAMSASRSLRR